MEPVTQPHPGWEANTHFGNPGGRREREKTKSVFKVIMTENFSNLARKINIQIHQAQGIPNRLNPKRAIETLSLNCQKSKRAI